MKSKFSLFAIVLTAAFFYQPSIRAETVVGTIKLFPNDNGKIVIVLRTSSVLGTYDILRGNNSTKEERRVVLHDISSANECIRLAKQVVSGQFLAISGSYLKMDSGKDLLVNVPGGLFSFKGIARCAIQR